MIDDGLLILLAVGTLFAQATLGRFLQQTALEILAVWLPPDRARTILTLLLAPGVALHETAHALVSLALGVPVGRIVLFNPEVEAEGKQRLGFVEHAACDPLRGLLIGIAPVLAPGLLLAVLTPLLLGSQLLAPRQSTFFTTLVAVFQLDLLTIVRLILHEGWRGGPVLLYGFFTLGTTVALSDSDVREFRPLAFITAGILLIVGALIYIHGLATVLDFARPLLTTLANGALTILVPNLLALLATLLVLAILRVGALIHPRTREVLYARRMTR